ncbi:MAG: DegQ family serine endoprotease [Chlamydiales bacterium]|nr:DegQ family serine endoprotease [Chlamydiales bacterium]
MKRFLILITFICTSLFADEALLREISKGFAEVAQNAIPAVVYIESQTAQTSATLRPRQGPFENPFEYFNDDFFNRFFGFPFQSDEGESDTVIYRVDRTRKGNNARGSGFIVSPDGLIITNNHVVENSSKVMVTLNDGRKMQAEVVGTDPQTDVAVIKIDETNLPYLKMGDSNELNVGDWTIAIGNPFGLQASLTVGVVSAKGRSQLQIADFEDFIQTDAAINPGNSGGPLLNVKGEVIGVNTAIASASGGYMGIGFAIPSVMVVQIKDQLVKDGEVTRGFLGVTLQPIDSDLAKFYHLDRPKGALVTDVVKDSPAEKAGLQQEDIILAYDSKPIENINAFRNAVSLMPPGTKVKLQINRDGKTKEITVVIAQAPGSAMGPDSPVEKLGLRVQTLTPEMASQLGITEEKGVVITQVDPDTPASMASLKPGSIILAVNRKKVSTAEEFTAAIAQAAKEGRVLLMVRQGEAVRFVALHFE